MAALAAAAPIHAQEPLGSLAGRLAAMSAPVGYESRVADSVARLLPAAMRDRAGNVVVPSPASRRLVACPLDEPGWTVGGIRDDGFLTVRRLPGRMPLLFDQYLEGQQVTVWGRTGAVPGVVAVRSTHLTRGRTQEDSPFTSDQAYIDIGARSAAEAVALGVVVTAPVAGTKRPHRYGTALLAAPVAGRRAACAALLRAVIATPRRSAVAAFVVEQGLGARGLLTAINEHGPFEEVVLLDGGASDAAVAVRADSISTRGGSVPIVRWTLRTRFAGTPVETVDLADAATLEQRLIAWLGGQR